MRAYDVIYIAPLTDAIMSQVCAENVYSSILNNKKGTPIKGLLFYYEKYKIKSQYVGAHA